MEGSFIFTLNQQFSILLLGRSKRLLGLGSGRGAEKWVWYEVMVGVND